MNLFRPTGSSHSHRIRKLFSILLLQVEHIVRTLVHQLVDCEVCDTVTVLELQLFEIENQFHEFVCQISGNVLKILI